MCVCAMHVYAHVHACMCVVYACVNTHMRAPQGKSALLKSNEMVSTWYVPLFILLFSENNVHM